MLGSVILVKGYLWFRIVIIKVVVGAVVGVVGFVQQLYGQSSAERLGHKRVLEDKQTDEKTQNGYSASFTELEMCCFDCSPAVVSQLWVSFLGSWSGPA